MAKRVRLSEVAALSAGGPRVVPHAGRVPFRSILLMMGEDGPRAFFNVCRHLPVPLDGASGRPPIEDGDWICGTHGARFELTSGFCHAGPCRGSSLMALRLEVEDGVVFGWVNDDGGPLP